MVEAVQRVMQPCYINVWTCNCNGASLPQNLVHSYVSILSTILVRNMRTCRIFLSVPTCHKLYNNLKNLWGLGQIKNVGPIYS